MSFEAPKQKSPDDQDNPNPSRRHALRMIGLAALAAGGALGAIQGAKVIGSGMDEFHARANKEAQEYNKFTHVGKALILNKVTKRPGEHPTNAELVSGAYANYMLGRLSGVPGAGLMFALNAVNTMKGSSEDHYLVIEINGKKPLVSKSFSGEYDSLKLGDTVRVKYHLSEKDTESVEWAQLNPPESALQGITPEGKE